MSPREVGPDFACDFRRSAASERGDASTMYTSTIATDSPP